MAKHYGIDGVGTLVELGKGGPKINNAAGVVEIKNNANNAYADLTAFKATVDSAQFSTTPTVGAYAEGKLFYDATWKTLSAECGRDVTLQIGQEDLRRVYNNTGALIENGYAVHVTGVYSGGTNDVITVALAKSDSATSAFVLGCATQDIPDGEYGFVTVRGHINGLNTNHLGAAYLVTQGMTFEALVGGTAGNAYTFTVIDTTTGGLSYTEVGGAVIVDLGGTTPTRAQLYTLINTTTPSAYIEVHTVDVPGNVIVASVLSFSGGVATAAGDVLYLSEVVSGKLRVGVPDAPNLEIRVGRVITKSATVGRVNIRINQGYRLNDLSDVASSLPAVDDTLKWNGSSWVNGPPVSSSASAGIDWWPDTTDIIAKTTENAFVVETLGKLPVTTAQSVEAIACTNNTVVGSAYLYDTALGRTTLEGGSWAVNAYCSVSSTGGGRISSTTFNMYTVRPYTSPTVTVTGSGTSRTCTASSGTPFAVTKIDASATNTLASFVQTPKGMYQITAITSDTAVTILTPTGYNNESTVGFSVWKKFGGVNTGTITTLTTNYGLYAKSFASASVTIEATDKLGMVVFGTSNNTTTVNYVYNGTANYSYFSSPLITLHNNLAGLNAVGGNYQHLTDLQLSGLTGGTSTTLHSHAVPTTITVAAEAADQTCYPLFVTGANGDLAPKTHASFGFDALNGWLGVGTATPSYKLDIRSTSTQASVTAVNIALATVCTADVGLVNTALSIDASSMAITAGVTDANSHSGIFTTVVGEGAGFAGTQSYSFGSRCYAGIGSTAAATAAVNYCYGGGFYCQNQKAGTTIANAYAVYANSKNAVTGTISNAWDFYGASATSYNYFAGSVGIGIASPTLAKVHILKAAADYLLPAILITGASTGTGAGEAAQGFGLYLTYNTSGNHQMLFAENETGKGVRYIGHGIDGCTIAGALADLNLGTDTNGAHVGTAVGSTQFSVSNLGGTASKVVCEIKGAAAQSGNYLNITTDQYTHPGEILSVTSAGDMFLGTYDVDGTPAIGRLVVKGSTNDGSTMIFVGRDSDEANIAWLDTNGKLGLGTLAAPGVNLDVHAATDGFTAIRAVAFGACYATVSVNRARGTQASPTAVTLGSYLGVIQWAGYYNATTQIPSSQIIAEATETWEASKYGANLLFLTTLTGAATPTERMKLSAATGTLQVHSGVVLGTDAATNTAGVLKFWGAGPNNYSSTFTAGTQSADASYTWPTAMPAVTGYVLSCTDAGVMSWAAAGGGVPTAITVAAEASDATCYPLFATAATGNLGPKTHASWSFDALNCRMGLGVAVPTAMLDIYSTTNTDIFMTAVGDAAFSVQRFYRARTGIAALTADNWLGGHTYHGRAQTSYNQCAYTGAWSGGVFTDASTPSYYTVHTTPVNSTTALERTRVTPAGYFGLGCSDPEVLFEASAAASAYFGVSSYGTATEAGFILRHGRGSRATRAALNTDDVLGAIYFSGYYDTSSGSIGTATIKAVATAMWSGTELSTDLRFSTTSVTTTAERMRITAAGVVSAYVGMCPATNDGAYLGTTTLGWADLHLATGGVINWANGNASITHSAGILTLNAVKLATGGETAPDVDAGGLCLNHGAGTDAVLTFKSSDVAHPFTTYSQTDTYGEFRKHVNASGGLLIRGFTEATTALEYRGYSVTASTGDYACVQMTAYYTDGSTGVTAFSDNSHIVGFCNNAVMKHVFNGGGDAVFVGALTVGARVGATPGAGAIQWSGTNFQGYNGSAWLNLDTSATITVAAEASDTTCFPVFVTASSAGDYGPKVSTSFTYDSSTGALASLLFAANTITANTGIVPDADGGAYIGTTALGWSGLCFSTGAVINWVNGDITLTHASNTLTLAGATWVALGGVAVTGMTTLGYGAVYDIGTQSSAITMTLSNGQHQKVTLSGNCALTIVDTGNIGDGNWSLEVIQNSTGGYNITSGTVSGGTVRTAGGTDPACTAAANGVDTFIIQKRGTVYTVSIAEKDLKTWA
jgi:hypothetical protein